MKRKSVLPFELEEQVAIAVIRMALKVPYRGGDYHIIDVPPLGRFHIILLKEKSDGFVDDAAPKNGPGPL